MEPGVNLTGWVEPDVNLAPAPNHWVGIPTLHKPRTVAICTVGIFTQRREGGRGGEGEKSLFRRGLNSWRRWGCLFPLCVWEMFVPGGQTNCLSPGNEQHDSTKRSTRLWIKSRSHHLGQSWSWNKQYFPVSINLGLNNQNLNIKTQKILCLGLEGPNLV